ncbi:class I SAM-dependent methyltransferase [Desulfonema magnum]|uniref:SAM-dependent methyltransferase n=1 Tax=Desulfonema magnum TaxID=45655 RepID=A0A975BGP8_9BACT|nr:class I SAM-dependent methyltransferase [Desulfonema magnum]QTA85192.1 SAM-dependent methyltransferase [Desulfonema magnum]
MQKDRIRWNEKYKNKETTSVKPSKIIEQFYRLAPKGRTLDIAAGTGKNSLFLAEKGFSVDAVDISDVALKTFSRCHSRVHAICADLDTFEIPRERYSLIVNTRFLNRRLFPYIREGLVTGGILIFESYLEGTGEDYCRPSCRDYLLRDNELLHAFLSMKILFYQETKIHDQKDFCHMASLVAVKI